MYMRSPYNTNYIIGTTTDINHTNIFLLSLAPVWAAYKDLKLALDLGATTNPLILSPVSEPTRPNCWNLSLTESLDLGISYMRTEGGLSETFGSQLASITRGEVGITWRF
jgi:hypothetical protein